MIPTGRKFCFRIVLRVALVVASLNLLNQAAHAQQFSFELVADTSTVAPGSGGASFEFFGEVAIDDGNVAFSGGTSDSVPFPVFSDRGLYLFNGGSINLIAEPFVPSEVTGISTTGNNVSISGNEIAFFGFRPATPSSPAQLGLFVQDVSPGGSLRNIVTTINPNLPGLSVPPLSPGGTNTFVGIDDFAIDNGTVIFAANDPDSPVGGVFVEQNGVVSVVADSNTPVPGTGSNFSSFSGVAIDGDNLFFSSSTPAELFVSNNDVIDALFATGSGSFSVSGNNVAQATSIGIVTHINGDVSLPIPTFGLSTTFFNVDDVSIDGENFAFSGFGAEDRGLYAQINGSLVSVIEEGDLLGGLTVSVVNIGDEGFRDNQIAFSVGFTDGSEAIFIASVIPEPTSVPLLAAVAILPWLRRRKKAH